MPLQRSSRQTDGEWENLTWRILSGAAISVGRKRLPQANAVSIIVPETKPAKLFIDMRDCFAIYFEAGTHTLAAKVCAAACHLNLMIKRILLITLLSCLPPSRPSAPIGVRCSTARTSPAGNML